MFAAKAGVLTLEPELIFKAVARCFHGAIADIPKPQNELEQSIKALVDRLSSSEVVDILHHGTGVGQSLSSASGYRTRDGQATQFVVRSEKIVGWLRDPLQVQRVLNWLDQKGFLKREKVRDKGHSKAIEWAQRQITWPDGSRPRSIVIVTPNGLADLAV